MIPTVVQGLGIAIISAGVSLVYLPAGIICAGIGTLLFGLALGLGKK